jgi:hypothetical protein
MFVQIIEGTTHDADGLRRQHDLWLREVRPDAAGFLGATAGITADGRTMNIVRFESEEQARANSERPEQGQWWSETEKYFDGEVRFTESSDVEDLRGGGSDAAGFVQVMKSQGVDRGRVHAFDQALDPYLDLRPEVLGGVRVWTGPDRCVEAIYFTDEADARAGEARERPPEVQAVFEEFGDLMEGVEFLDLPDPWLA